MVAVAVPVGALTYGSNDRRGLMWWVAIATS